MTQLKYIIYRDNQRIELPPQTAAQIHKRTRNLSCGGRVWDLMQSGYRLQPITTKA
jgi:hypothetical protein